jgi:hypothetical protein
MRDVRWLLASAGEDGHFAAALEQVEDVLTPEARRRLSCLGTRVTEGDNADYTNWEAVAVALARHITNRNGDRRDRRMTMPCRVHRNLPDHWPKRVAGPPKAGQQSLQLFLRAAGQPKPVRPSRG